MRLEEEEGIRGKNDVATDCARSNGKGGGVTSMWLSSAVLFTAALMILAGLALLFDAGVHFVRTLYAEERSHRR